MPKEAITSEDLQKSIDMLEDFANENDTDSRKAQLLSKASTDGLSKGENEELFQILGGQEPQASGGDAITKSLTGNEALQKSLDVSDYLQENHDAMVKSLGSVAEAMEKSDSRVHEFALLQAKALVDIGTMVKSMNATMESVLSQPAAGPRSVGVQGAQPLNKSFAGQAPAEEQLSKSDVLDGFDGLMEESMAKGGVGRLGNGEDIAVATAKFESGNEISPFALQEVQRWRQRQAS